MNPGATDGDHVAGDPGDVVPIVRGGWGED